MTHTAVTFSIADVEHSPIGVAVVCISARYISVICRPSVSGVDRKHASPKQWKQIEVDVRAGLPTSPLPSWSALSAVLADPIERQTIQWLHSMPISVERPEDVAAALDWHLQQQANELRLQMKLREERGN